MTLHVLRSVFFLLSILVILRDYFWGNSCHSASVFKIQNSTIRIITNKRKRDSCQQLFKTLQVLTAPSQYIFSLLVFVVKHKGLFLYNSEIHNINKIHNHNVHYCWTNLTLVQKGVFYSCCKVFNHLLENIKVLSHDLKHFKSVLKSFLIEHTFYSLEEFYQTPSN